MTVTRRIGRKRGNFLSEPLRVRRSLPSEGLQGYVAASVIGGERKTVKMISVAPTDRKKELQATSGRETRQIRTLVSD